MSAQNIIAFRQRFHCLIFFVVMVLAIGCSGGPPLGTVEGVVTMDKKPLANADVVFTPENGRHATAKTDSQGRYRIEYMPGREGAIVGKHKVSISRMDPNSFVEMIPAKYNTRTELTATVTKGGNVINFELKSR